MGKIVLELLKKAGLKTTGVAGMAASFVIDLLLKLIGREVAKKVKEKKAKKNEKKQKESKKNRS